MKRLLEVSIFVLTFFGVSAVIAVNNTMEYYTGSDWRDVFDFTLSNVSIHASTLGGNGLVIGSDFDDTIIGGLGNDLLFSGEGNDTFVSEGDGQGADTLDGGGGTDTLQGGVNDDVFGLKWISSVEIIDGGLGVNIIEGTQNRDDLDFSNTELFFISYIDGREGNDRITGSSANDTIIGGLGNDSLIGGGGVMIPSSAKGTARERTGLMVVAVQIRCKAG